MSILKKVLPYVKEGVIVCMIMSTGDLLCQTVVEEKPIKQINVTRCAKFGSIGLFFIGPSLHYWFRLLDRLIPHNQPTLHRGLKKMALDQMFSAPTYMFTVLCLNNILNGKSFEQFKHHLRTEYIEMLKKNYMIWPFVMTFNFTVVPVAYQVIFTQIVAIFWNGYISYILNKNKIKNEN